MELYLIRHGQSQNNALPEEQRVQDPALTDLGRRQVAHLADWVASTGATRLISSPFLRTMETAEPVRRSTGVSAEIWVELHEQGGCVSGPTPAVMQGQPGMTRTELNRCFSEFRVPSDLDGQGWWRSQPYEILEQARDRARKLVRRTREEFAHTDERVLYVMHATFMLLLVECFMQDDPPGYYADNASVTKLILTPKTTRLEYYNQVDHLPVDLVT